MRKLFSPLQRFGKRKSARVATLTLLVVATACDPVRNDEAQIPPAATVTQGQVPPAGIATRPPDLPTPTVTTEPRAANLPTATPLSQVAQEPTIHIAPAEPTVPAVPQQREQSTMQLLHRQGKDILDEQGNRVILKGVNFGGACLSSGYELGVLLMSETEFYDKVGKAVGDAAAEQFRMDLCNHFIKAEDFRKAAEMGFNSVRLPFNYRILEDDEQPFVYKESGWAALDKLIDAAEKHGIYVILDMHSAPGGQSAAFVNDPARQNGKPDKESLLWGETKEGKETPEANLNKQRTVALWQAIAGRYADRKNIAGYDLLNEPATSEGQGKELVDLYQQIISGIRQVDKNHMVFIEGDKGSWDFSAFTERFRQTGRLLDENMVYAPHLYSFFVDTPGDSDNIAERGIRSSLMNGMRDMEEEQQVPIWIGEFGENDYATINADLDAMNNPENSIDGYAFWLWKRPSAIHPNLHYIQRPESWKKLGGFINLPVLKPSEEEARKGLQDFLNASDINRVETDQQMVTIFQKYLP